MNKKITALICTAAMLLVSGCSEQNGSNDSPVQTESSSGLNLYVYRYLFKSSKVYLPTPGQTKARMGFPNLVSVPGKRKLCRID